MKNFYTFDHCIKILAVDSKEFKHFSELNDTEKDFYIRYILSLNLSDDTLKSNSERYESIEAARKNAFSIKYSVGYYGLKIEYCMIWKHYITEKGTFSESVEILDWGGRILCLVNFLQ